MTVTAEFSKMSVVLRVNGEVSPTTAPEFAAYRALRHFSRLSGMPLRQEAENIVRSAGQRPSEHPRPVLSGWPWPAS